MPAALPAGADSTLTLIARVTVPEPFPVKPVALSVQVVLRAGVTAVLPLAGTAPTP